MRRANKNKAEKPSREKSEVQNEMFLKKADNKAIALLEEIKSTPDKRTRQVIAKDFGFNSSLIMFVDPNLPDDKIIAKFQARLNTNFGWFTDKLKQHV